MNRSVIVRSAAGLTALGLAAGLAVTGTATASSRPGRGPAEHEEFVVLAEAGATDAAVRQAIAGAGGQVTDVNAAIGMYTVEAPADSFATDVAGSPAVLGAATNDVIGQAPADRHHRDRVIEEDFDAAGPGETVTPAAVGDPEPLAARQWDMDMIHAPAAHDVESGDRVRVGIIDTGIDGSHPDIAPNFNAALSRNFTTDIELIDGSCAAEPDASCADPANVDENGHGTHVAGTVGSPINGVGIAGVAPDVELVNLRAGQDSGYFFLAATVNALTYAAQNGIDVVNMSYYIDPWLYNCAANPADSPAAQLEQQTIIEATNRALKYARQRGVTLVGAAGNSNTDLGNPTFDPTSPDFPPGAEYDRTVDNSCLDLPTEGFGTISVSSIGPSGLKADYSNWGTEQIQVSAPGGYTRDFFGTPRYLAPENAILAAYPKALALNDPRVDKITGASVSRAVIAECSAPGIANCVYYRYIQGTSMASPHAAGVAALIVGKWGHRDGRSGGLAMNPHQVEKTLERSATDTACPAPVFDYPDRPDVYTSNCDGDAAFNGWYGEGIVNALQAVTQKN